jgi:hypothetical protein
MVVGAALKVFLLSLLVVLVIACSIYPSFDVTVKCIEINLPGTGSTVECYVDEAGVEETASTSETYIVDASMQHIDMGEHIDMNEHDASAETDAETDAASIDEPCVPGILGIPDVWWEIVDCGSGSDGGT